MWHIESIMMRRLNQLNGIKSLTYIVVVCFSVQLFQIFPLCDLMHCELVLLLSHRKTQVCLLLEVKEICGKEIYQKQHEQNRLS